MDPGSELLPRSHGKNSPVGRDIQAADILKALWREDDLQVFGKQKLCVAMCHSQSQL